MVSTVGRRKEHDDKTAEALLDAAERTIADGGVDALSLRQMANDVGTSTRAIYSLFGSKNGLVAALGVRAFNLLQRDIETLAATDQPVQDLVEVALIFRQFALEHPALFQIAFHRSDPAIWPHLRAAATDALVVLDKRFEPLADTDLLGGRSISEASTQFRALCEGAAWTELRGNPLPPDPERFWRNAFHALIIGLATPPPSPQQRTTRRRRRAAASTSRA